MALRKEPEAATDMASGLARNEGGDDSEFTVVVGREKTTLPRRSPRRPARRGGLEEKIPEPKKTGTGVRKASSVPRQRRNTARPRTLGDRMRELAARGRRNAITSLPREAEDSPIIAAARSNRPTPTFTRSFDTLQEEGPVCMACYDDDDAQPLFRLSCDHHYCYPCATGWLRTAIHDEGEYPAGCCRDWDVDIERAKEVPALRAVAEQYERKAIEWNTGNRTYCANPHCAKFLGGDDSPNLRCDVCNISTCVQCKSTAHPEQPCPKDEEMERTLQMATSQSWRRCPSCRNLVERVEGCDDLICRCGQHFCYKCGNTIDICQCLDDILTDEGEGELDDLFGHTRSGRLFR